MKKLPIGDQSFAELLRSGALYVDKTEEIYKLLGEIANDSNYFDKGQFGTYSKLLNKLLLRLNKLILRLNKLLRLTLFRLFLRLNK